MQEIRALPLPKKALNLIGISSDQIRPHYEDLYTGYVTEINRIRSLLKTESLDPLFFRGLKVAETYNLDGVKLHEQYFYNLSPHGGKPSLALQTALTKSFGSFENWAEDFIRTGRAARGWAILAYDPRDQELHNFLLDAHDEGVISDWCPLLVLDVYEHAYYIDFSTDKMAYLEAFMVNIDWQMVNTRFTGISLPDHSETAPRKGG